jgi:Alpha and gamma adaptin binding protein p34
MRRIREVLEAHQWADSHDSEDMDRLLDSEGEEDGFNLEVNELEREMMGLRTAIEKAGPGDEADDDGDDGEQSDAELKVEGMEALMMRIRAIRGIYLPSSLFSCLPSQAEHRLSDLSADLPEKERKAFAEKAIRDIMKEL